MEEAKQQAEADLGHLCVCVWTCFYAHLLESFFPYKARNSISQSASLKYVPCAGGGNWACAWKTQDEVKQEHKDKLAQ